MPQAGERNYARKGKVATLRGVLQQRKEKKKISSGQHGQRRTKISRLRHPASRKTEGKKKAMASMKDSSEYVFREAESAERHHRGGAFASRPIAVWMNVVFSGWVVWQCKQERGGASDSTWTFYYQWQSNNIDLLILSNA